MSYSKRPVRRLRGMGADTTHGPTWYTHQGLGSVVSAPPKQRMPRKFGPRYRGELGSLGADDASGSTLDTSTLATATISDPQVAWQQQVLAELHAGVATMRTAELQKWLQIAATLSIPLAAAIWRMIFKRGVSGGDGTV